jgi:hypothetical protein
MPNTRTRYPLVTWLLLIAAVGTILASPSAPLAASTAPQPFRLISSDASHVVIEFSLPSYSLEEVTLDGQVCLRPVADGYQLTEDPSRPQLPQIVKPLGLPPTGTFSVQVLDEEKSVVALSHPICPAPTPLVDRDALPSDPAYGLVSGYAFERDAAVYDQDAPYPAQAASVIEVGKMRGHRVAQATFSPLRYRPLGGELQVTRRLVLEVRFEWAPSLAAAGRQEPRSPAFDQLLSQALPNYSEAQDWRVPRAESMLSAQALSSSSPAYKVIVDATGLYRMTYSDLQAAGLPVTQINPATFELSTGGQPVSIQVQGNGDAHFDANEAIEFYGYVPESRYTDQNIYWLHYSGTAQQMGVRSVAPVSSDPDGLPRAVARYEPNTRYDATCTGADSDHWFVAELRAIYAPQHTASLTLQPPYGGSYQAEVTAGLVMKRGRYHHVRIAVNGVSVYDHTWTDADARRDPYPYSAVATFSGSLLRAGANSVLVTVDGSDEITWVDYVELDYAISATNADAITFRGQAGTREYVMGGFSGGPIRIYDITDPDAPVQLANAAGASSGPQIRFSDTRSAPATYYALRTSQIRQPSAIYRDSPPALALQASSNGADYLIISHADFIGAIQPLVALHQGQGLQVQVVDVQDVYDEFNAGLLSPQAIHDFISYAYHSWATPPTYVLLVGDGSYDFLNHAGWNPPNYMPPYLQMVERGLWQESAETAADNRYADVDADDPLPLADLFIGRLPVRSAAEAATVVQKIVTYEQSPSPGSWNMRHVFAIDVDESGFFRTIVQGAYSYIHSPFYKQVIDLNATTVPAAKQQVMDAWNAGALFMTYAGNGSWHQWSGEQLLHIDNVASMINGGRLPVMLSMTCYTGYFQHPEYGTLDETMLRRSGGGAVATWSPSELTSGHNILLSNFYDAVYSQGLSALGPAIAAAKSTLSSDYVSAIDTYHLFGDPAMGLQLEALPSGGSVYLPAVLRNY